MQRQNCYDKRWGCKPKTPTQEAYLHLTLPGRYNKGPIGDFVTLKILQGRHPVTK